MVGSYWDENGLPCGFVWEAGRTTELGSWPGHDQVYASVINDIGQVVGHAWTAGPVSVSHAFLWDSGTFMLIGEDGDSGTGINDQGQAVTQKGLLWLPEAAYGLPAGQSDTGLRPLRSINNRGQIVGGTGGAILWQEGHVTEIGELDEAADINARGQVAGFGMASNGHQHGFMWEAGGMMDLGVLNGDTDSYARAINDYGQVVGYSTVSIGGYKYDSAFLWEAGQMVDLNSLLVPTDSGWDLREALDINDLGQILCTGWRGAEHGFLLLTPIPEPATLSLLGLGSLALLHMRCRRREAGARPV